MKLKVYEWGQKVIAHNQREAKRKLEAEFGDRVPLNQLSRFRGPFKLTDDCGETDFEVSEEEFCRIVDRYGEDIVAEA